MESGDENIAKMTIDLEKLDVSLNSGSQYVLLHFNNVQIKYIIL